jgi:hypothetical protein
MSYERQSSPTLKKLTMKKSIVPHTEYKPVARSFSGELFSKKKQRFPTRRIYVSDVPSSLETDEIQKAFAAHGEVTYIEDSDSPVTDDTKSIFVTYAKAEDAVAILKEPTFELNDTTVSVCEAVPKKTQVFVGGLRPETDEDDLVVFFSNYGTVCEAVLKTDGRTGLSRCFGFVTFVDSQSAVKDLLKSRFLEMNGKRIELKPAVPMNQQSRMKRAQMAVAMNVANTQVSNISKLTNRKPSNEMNNYGSALSQGHGVTYPNMFGTLPMDYGYPRPPQFQSNLPAPMNRRQYQFQYRY